MYMYTYKNFILVPFISITYISLFCARDQRVFIYGTLAFEVSFRRKYVNEVPENIVRVSSSIDTRK